jgi:hypothetical protein
MKHFTTAEHAAVKLRDVFNQASVAAYEKASEGLNVAEGFRKELFRSQIKALSSFASSSLSSTYRGTPASVPPLCLDIIFDLESE